MLHGLIEGWSLEDTARFGLGTETRYYLNLLYVKQDNVPDGGVPTLGLPGWTPQPTLEALAGHPIRSKITLTGRS